MNQILSVENINNKKKGKKAKRGSYNGSTEEKKIIRFFAIALIVFGVFNIGTGAFAMYKNQQERANRPIKPTISVEKVSEEKIKLKVNSEKNSINEVYYRWNDGEETKKSGNGRNEIVQEIDIPEGDNVLHVRAITTSGQTQEFEQRFVRDIKISIQIENADPQILIRLEGKDEIAYMTYSWNGEEQEKIDEINSTRWEKYIEPKAGENTLKVFAKDVNGNTKEKEMKITGVEPGDVPVEGGEGEPGSGNPAQLTTKPSLTIEKEDERFLIYAKDDAGLKRIELVVNGDTENKVTLDLDGRKEQNFDYPIEVGQNSIEVTIYNVNNESTTQKSTANRAQ